LIDLSLINVPNIHAMIQTDNIKHGKITHRKRNIKNNQVNCVISAGSIICHYPTRAYSEDNLNKHNYMMLYNLTIVSIINTFMTVLVG